MSNMSRSGTMGNPIIDCAMTEQEAIWSILRFRPCPEQILRNQRLITVRYLCFDGFYHQGQLVVHQAHVTDIHDLFRLIYRIGFPVAQVIPISKFGWDDIRSMKANNSSGFNYREIAGQKNLSLHAFGEAIDTNPWQNPWTCPGKTNQPMGALYRPKIRGTLTSSSPIVRFLKGRGWAWAGEGNYPLDYQHFQKAQKQFELPQAA